MKKKALIKIMSCSSIIIFVLTYKVFAQLESSIKTFTQSFEKKEGFVDYYWDESKGKLYLEIKNLGEEMLYVNYLSAGLGSNDIGLDRGQIGGSRIVKFVKMGPKIFMIQPNYTYLAITENKEEKKSVEDAFAKSTLWSFNIVASEKNKHLIDATDFIVNDSHSISQKINQRRQGSFKLDKNFSSFDYANSKNFPLNSELESFLTFRGTSAGSFLRSVSPDNESFSVRTRHSFVQLPDDGYKPRIFDPRAGYGSLTYYDYASPVDTKLEKKFIRRHRLVKKYPEKEISEAVEPIVYYLDRGVPEPVRSALIEGASWWNDAFEAAGFKDAFQIKVLPEGADLLDIRYNVIQWVHRSTRGWSYGSSVVDPRTGEIIKGHVSLGSLRVRQDYLIAEGLLRPYGSIEKNQEMEKMSIRRLQQLSAHEVGHTLGLSHNYISSARNRKSVMDYPHPLIKMVNGEIDLSEAYDYGIGDWDKLAINWGYRQFEKEENEGLNNILLEGYKRDIYFITDQDSRPISSAHPRSHLWDNGFSASEELDRMLKIRRYVLDNLNENVIKEGEPMSSIEEALVPMYLLHRYQIEAASKVVGGLDYNYAVKGDGQVVTSLVSFSDQEKAIDALLSSISPKNLSLPESLLKIIPPRANGYPRTRETFKSRAGLVFDYISAAESATQMVLSALLNPERATRLVSYKARNNNQPGLEYVLNRLIQSTIFSNQTKFNGIEKELQNMVNYSVLDNLFSLAGQNSSHVEVNAITYKVLNDLKATLQKSESHQNKYMVSRINSFMDGDIELSFPTQLSPPDGSPIGSDIMEFCGGSL